MAQDESEELLPPEITGSETFISNAKQLCGLDGEVLKRLRRNLPANPSDLRDVATRRSLAEKVGIEEKTYGIMAAFVRMLMAAADNGGAEPKAVVDFIVQKAECDITSEKTQELINFFSETLDEKEKEEAVNAFYFGLSYAGVEFRPLIAPMGLVKRPKYFLGGNLTINSIDQDNQKQHFSIQISYSELAELSASIKRALETLEALNEPMKNLCGAAMTSETESASASDGEAS